MKSNPRTQTARNAVIDMATSLEWTSPACVNGKIIAGWALKSPEEIVRNLLARPEAALLVVEQSESSYSDLHRTFRNPCFLELLVRKRF
jgi:hypothetical protein